MTDLRTLLGPEPPMAPVDVLLADVSARLGHGVALRSSRVGWELHHADHGYIGTGRTLPEALSTGLRHPTHRNVGSVEEPDDIPHLSRPVTPPVAGTTVCECRAQTAGGCRACAFRGTRPAELVVCVEGGHEPVLDWVDPARAWPVPVGRCRRHPGCATLAVRIGDLVAPSLVAAGATTRSHTLVAGTDDTAGFAGWADLYLPVAAGCVTEPEPVAAVLLAALAGWSGDGPQSPAMAGVGVDRFRRATSWSGRIIGRVPLRAALDELTGRRDLWLSGAGFTFGDPGWRCRVDGVDVVEGWLLADVLCAAAGLVAAARR